MSAVTAAAPRPASPLDVVGLQYANRHRMIGVPVYILGAVVLITVVISVAILRAGGNLKGADYNGSILYSLLGYTVAVGVQNVASNFPFALALGGTRHTFVLGNLLTAAVQSLLVAGVAIVLLGLEVVTGGWFIGARALSSTLLGSGNPAVLGGTMLLAILTALSVGGAFGSSYVRFGAVGPLMLTIGIVAVIVILLFLVIPQAPAIADAARPWWIAVAASTLIGLSTIGQYFFLRRASVR